MPDRTTHNALPVYFGWIDAMRGVAALCVVIFHYHQFYLAEYNVTALEIPTEEFPYGSILGTIYSSGEDAVRLFWVISGFVFAHVYWNRETALSDFSVARFARLYPLHIATLLLVAGLQTFSMAQFGYWQVYGGNDLSHFLQQILLLDHSLNLAREPSFNGPIWSVSAEIFAYAVFFASLPMTRRKPIAGSVLLVVTAFGILNLFPEGFLVGKWALICAVFFFAGSATFAVFRALGGATVRVLAVSAGLVWAAWIGGTLGSENLKLVASCCAIVLALAQLEVLAAGVGRGLRFLGDTSYSIYLVHVPIQIIALIAADLAFDGDRSFAQSHFTLPVYLLVTTAAAYLVHRYFEKPAARWIRGQHARLSRSRRRFSL